MERYTLLLEEQVAAMRTRESSDASKLERMTHGAKAMRDSSMIYLSYAKFIAYGMPDSEDLIKRIYRVSCHGALSLKEGPVRVNPDGLFLFQRTFRCSA